MEVLLLILRLALAGIFGLAGVAKFLDLKGSEKAFREFGVPAAIALPSSIALSIFEIAIAAMLLFTTTSWVAAVCALFLLVLFIGQMIYQMAKGNAPDCHCFGQVHSEPVSKISVIRNAIFAIPAAVLVARGQAQGMSLTDPNLDVMQLVFGVVTVGLLLAVFFYLKKVSEQQRQIMRRLEVMELIAQDGGSVTRDEAGLPNEGLPIGALFPDFELPDLDGNVVTLADLKAEHKPVLFLFVSPTCNPCKALLPEFEQWQDELSDKLRLVFLSNGSAEDNADKFEGDATKTILLQNEREVAEAVFAQWTPTAILMDANGRIASHVAAGDGAIRELVGKFKASSSQETAFFTNGHGHTHGSKLGKMIPEFSLTDIHGNNVSSDSFKGRETVVAFWSLTCPFCREAIADLRDWDNAKAADEPALVLFSEGDLNEHQEFGLRSSIILEEGYKTAEKFGMYGTPSAVLVNKHGRIISETVQGAQGIWSLVGRKK